MRSRASDSALRPAFAEVLGEEVKLPKRTPMDFMPGR